MCMLCLRDVIAVLDANKLMKMQMSLFIAICGAWMLGSSYVQTGEIYLYFYILQKDFKHIQYLFSSSCCCYC